jgi:diadenylate cyclase
MDLLQPAWDFVRTVPDKWKIPFDILLVAYVAYRIFLAVRGTRGVQLVRGLAVILLLYAVSQPLPTLHYLMRQLLLPGIIAIIIIFQPELRMALERLGRGRLLGGTFSIFEREDPTEVINIVVDAAEELADKRQGALIVLERSTGLVDVTRTGKPIGGHVSVELLSTLFNPYSPLHDGAVVISDNEVVAAACVLPHSESPGLAASTGMRHRAALGLAERTDAAVVVVSEETGQVSLAVNGQISPDLGRAELSERLLHLMAPARPGRRLLFWQR